jgi:hypothetical protein
MKLYTTSQIVRDLRKAIQQQTPKQKRALRAALRKIYRLPEGK